MTDLINIFANLVDCHGNINIPGIMDSVKSVTDEDKYESIEFDVVRAEKTLKVLKLLRLLHSLSRKELSSDFNSTSFVEGFERIVYDQLSNHFERNSPLAI